MLQFKNATPFKGTIYLLPDADGIDTLFSVVKATLTLGERLSIADEQAPVTLADEYHGDPGTSSIKDPSDVSLTKPAADVLLTGSAYAPAGRPVAQTDVTLAVGPARRTVRVYGDRVWRKSGIGHAISAPQPFMQMPLVWERAYGGMDVADGEPRAEPRNPVGAGYRAPDGDTPLDGLRLPNLEDPADLITSSKQRPAPAAFAPICGHWLPRQSFAGTYDERWQQERAPYLPADFDPRFLQVAPPGLVVPLLQPGEWVQVQGASPTGQLRFQLPPVRMEVTYVVDGAPEPVPAALDTMVIQPDQNRVLLVWRAALRCDKRALRVNEVRAAALKAA